MSCLDEDFMYQLEDRPLLTHVHQHSKHTLPLPQALSYLDEDFMYQLEGRYYDQAEAVKLRVHLNMAAVQIKTGDYNTAVYNCSQVRRWWRWWWWCEAGAGMEAGLQVVRKSERERWPGCERALCGSKHTSALSDCLPGKSRGDLHCHAPS